MIKFRQRQFAIAAMATKSTLLLIFVQIGINIKTFLYATANEDVKESPLEGDSGLASNRASRCA